MTSLQDPVLAIQEDHTFSKQGSVTPALAHNQGTKGGDETCLGDTEVQQGVLMQANFASLSLTWA